MSRGYTASNLSAIQADVTTEIIFAEFNFDEGTERVHSGFGSIVWGGNTWTGGGDLVAMDTMSEREELSPVAVQFSLSAIDPNLIDLALTSDIYGRRVRVYTGHLNLETGQLADDPQLFWSGVMDSIEAQIGGASEGIALNCESDLRNFKRKNNSLYTDQQQQQNYSGDVFFQYLAQIEGANIVWGQRGTVTFNQNPPAYPIPNFDDLFLA